MSRHHEWVSEALMLCNLRVYLLLSFQNALITISTFVIMITKIIITYVLFGDIRVQNLTPLLLARKLFENPPQSPLNCHNTISPSTPTRDRYTGPAYIHAGTPSQPPAAFTTHAVSPFPHNVDNIWLPSSE